MEFFPVGSRSYLARPLADGTAAGKEHGAMRPKPAAGQRPAPRGNCLPQFPVCCGTTGVTEERLWVSSLTSRVVPCSARCLPRRSLAEPGPNRPNCRNCPKSSRYFPGGSRSSLARPLADGTAAGKSMGLCAPNPQQVRDLHHAEIAYRNFPYAVEPPTEPRFKT